MKIEFNVLARLAHNASPDQNLAIRLAAHAATYPRAPFSLLSGQYGAAMNIQSPRLALLEQFLNVPTADHAKPLLPFLDNVLQQKVAQFIAENAAAENRVRAAVEHIKQLVNVSDHSMARHDDAATAVAERVVLAPDVAPASQQETFEQNAPAVPCAQGGLALADLLNQVEAAPNQENLQMLRRCWDLQRERVDASKWQAVEQSLREVVIAPMNTALFAEIVQAMVKLEADKVGNPLAKRVHAESSSTQDNAAQVQNERAQRRGENAHEQVRAELALKSKQMADQKRADDYVDTLKEIAAQHRPT
ncbi:hypothetical protein [Duganella qianjiadongensis]|uniref:DUF1631 family protein n=1 Tax=Duganella qianjiadongensis TaxID=2692176 RepID=A0ABW9VEY4_9BURK|nr:hypothetical protein [Duganella qianjiadongensis]MYM38030.1 hypothetical protein [Duganella qianjiadongensis]